MIADTATSREPPITLSTVAAMHARTPPDTCTRVATITNPCGLHLRPCAAIAEKSAAILQVGEEIENSKRHRVYRQGDTIRGTDIVLTDIQVGAPMVRLTKKGQTIILRMSDNENWWE